MVVFICVSMTFIDSLMVSTSAVLLYRKKDIASKSQTGSWQFSCTVAESFAVRSEKLFAAQYLQDQMWPG